MFSGAENFNGGGFIASPEGQAGGSAQKKNYDQGSQSVRKVSIRQIYSGVEQSGSNELIVSGKELVNIGIVGKIISVKDEHVTYNLVVDDGTGRIAVKIFMNGDDPDAERQRLAELREGSYVRIFGHISSIQGEKVLQAFSARPVTDHNEVTYHLSQIIFQHVHLSKGGSDISGVPPMANMDAAAAGGFGAAPAPVAAAGGFGNNGFTPIQNDVLAFFKAPDAMNIEAGLTAVDIIARSNNRYSKAQIDDAINFLVNDGHLYSTIDDQHFKSCDA